MSSVIKSNKKLYKISFLIELLSIITLTFLVSLISDKALSFLLGAFIAFIPQVIFITYNLYTNRGRKSVISMKYFYAGEAIKFVITVILFVSVFILFTQITPIVFFSGYLIFILFNVLLPLLLQNSDRVRPNS